MADGAMSKRVHPGRASEIGLTAALLARRGVTGPAQVLDAPWAASTRRARRARATPA
jgi:2-methylcitrate dehydratase PrpD